VESHGPAAPFTGTVLATTFTKYYIPVPTPAALAAVSGLFYFSSGCLPLGTNVWVNDIQFETLTSSQLTSTFGAPIEALTQAPGTLGVVIGTPQLIGNIGPNTVNYASASVYQVGWGYFTYASSNTAVATVDANGMVVGHAAGTANITMSFPGTALSRVIAVTVTAPLAVPTSLAPTPTHPAGNVISLFNSSGTYTNHTVDTWNAGWSPQILSNFVISGKTVMLYTGLDYAGVEFTSVPVDATGYTNFHVDIWTPNGAKFGIQLVNNVTSGTKTIGQVDLTTSTTPAVTTGSWVGLDIPLSSFTSAGLGGVNALGQILWLNQGAGSVPGALFYIDNVYFWK
jgi:hypothetical protein